MERHLFAGGNTKNGFVNLYNNVIDRRSCKRLYIIKGGSGVGKSTMLKKIAAKVKAKTKDIEYFHCSADIGSLDGVRFPELNTAMLDGTNPHVVEPVYIKMSDYTVDLSPYIDGEKLKTAKPKLAKLLDGKAKCYERAYSLIKSAGIVFDSIADTYSKNIITTEMENVLAALQGYIKTSKKRQNRKLFSGAITGEGEVYLGGELDGLSVVRLLGDSIAASCVLGALAERLAHESHSLTYFYAPIGTDYIYELEVDGKVLFTVNTTIGTTGAKHEADIMRTITPNSSDENYIKSCYDHYKALIGAASDCLSYAKEYHNGIEELYIPCVNFEGVDAETEKIAADIMCDEPH